MLLVPKTEFEKSLAEAFKELPEISSAWTIVTGLQGKYVISKRLGDDWVFVNITDPEIWGITKMLKGLALVVFHAANALYPTDELYCKYYLSANVKFEALRAQLEKNHLPS